MRLAAVLWLSFDVKLLVGIKFQGHFCGLRVNTFFDVCDLHAMKLYDYELYFLLFLLTVVSTFFKIFRSCCRKQSPCRPSQIKLSELTSHFT